VRGLRSASPMSKRLLLFLLWLLLPAVSFAQTVVVWDFSTRDGKKNDTTASLTHEFEEALAQDRTYTVLERRNLARLQAVIENEKVLQDIGQISAPGSSELKKLGVSLVAFGEVFDDVESGDVSITVTFQDFTGRQLLIKSVLMRRGLLRDATSRRENMAALVQAISKMTAAANRIPEKPNPSSGTVSGPIESGAATQVQVTDATGSSYVLREPEIAYPSGFGPSREKGIRVFRGTSETFLEWTRMRSLAFAGHQEKNAKGTEVWQYDVTVELTDGTKAVVRLADDWNMAYMGGGGTGLLFGKTELGDSSVKFSEVREIRVLQTTNLPASDHTQQLQRLVLSDAAATYSVPHPRYSASWKIDHLPGEPITGAATISVQSRDPNTVFFSTVLDIQQSSAVFTPHHAHVIGTLRWDSSVQRYLLDLTLGHPEGQAAGVATDAQISRARLNYSQEAGFTGTGSLEMYEQAYEAKVAISTDETKHEQVWRISTLDDAVVIQFRFEQK